MKIPGLPDILISRARLEAQCERYGHHWFNQVGFGVFCRQCGTVLSNNEMKLTRSWLAGSEVDSSDEAQPEPTAVTGGTAEHHR